MKRCMILLILISFGCATQQAKIVQTQTVEKPYNAKISYIKQTSINCNLSSKKLDKLSEEDSIEVANDCYLKNNSKSLELVAQSLADKNTKSPWGVYFLSLAAELRGEHDKSLWMINRAIQRGPQVAPFYFQRARIYWKMGEYGLSVEDFNATLKNDPTISEAHEFLAQIYIRDDEQKMADKHRAIATLKKEAQQ